jgi:hypothetical protein
MTKRQQAIQQKIEDKKIKIKLLKKAHSRIKNHLSYYICFALTASEESILEYLASRSLKCYILKQLKGFSTLESWQDKKRVYKNEWQVRKDRCNWIKWMISCLEEDIVSLNEKLLKGKLK